MFSKLRDRRNNKEKIAILDALISQFPKVFLTADLSDAGDYHHGTNIRILTSELSYEETLSYDQINELVSKLRLFAPQANVDYIPSTGGIFLSGSRYYIKDHFALLQDCLERYEKRIKSTDGDVKSEEKESEKSDEALLKEEIRKIFEEFPSTLILASLAEEKSDSPDVNSTLILRIPVKDLLIAKQNKLNDLLWSSLIKDSADMSLDQDKEIVCTAIDKDGKECLRIIFQLIQVVKQFYSAEEDAYTDGAAAGALSKDFPKELGEHVGSFLDRAAGGSLAQTSQAARQSAEDGRTEFKKNKSGPGA